MFLKFCETRDHFEKDDIYTWCVNFPLAFFSFVSPYLNPYHHKLQWKILKQKIQFILLLFHQNNSVLT